jgi:diguanylate cyclase (GGDEF)-like protein/PAS domain S-box-containing protein
VPGVGRPRGRPADGARVDTQTSFRGALAALLVAGAVLLLVPGGSLAAMGVLLTVTLAALTAVVWRLRRTAPGHRGAWRLLAAALAAAATGDLLHLVLLGALGLDLGYPHVSHLAYVTALGLFAAAIVAVGCARRGRDLGNALDALVVGASASFAAWATIGDPVRMVLPETPLVTAVFVAVPLVQLLLLTATVHLWLGSRARGTSVRILVVAATLATGSTLALGVRLLAGAQGRTTPSDLGWLAIVGLLGLAASHAGVSELTTRQPPRRDPAARHRLLAPASATLILPAVALTVARSQLEVILAAVLAAVLVLVTLRVWLLLGELRTARDREVADQRRRDQRRFEALVRHTTDVLLVVGADATVTYASPSAATTLGEDPTGWPTRRLTSLLHPAERGATLAALGDRLGTADGRPVRLAARLADRDGREQHVEMVAVDLRDDPDVAGTVLTVRETTERAELERELRRLAFHDPLTDLPNRELFQDHLAAARQRAARSGRPLAVLMCDLDDFKDVNDTLGHAAGDQLLRAVATRLREAVRTTDTVARLGGDEFGVLCDEVASAEEAAGLAERLLDALRPPVEVDGQALRVGISVGLTLDTGERSVEELLRDADVAMYAAKAGGKHTWTLHRASMTTRTRVRRELAADLRDAVDAGAIDVAYQPLVDLGTGLTTGVEALARWTHPTRGPVSPEEFVPLAEHTGSIEALGAAVLDQALATARTWRRARPDLDLDLGVNLSARQLADGDLVEVVTQALARHGGDPGRLVLELTETAVLEDTPRAVAVMHELRELGVRFAIDDFGTGYSSLAYLQRLPVDVVKIDRSFVAALGRDRSAEGLVRAIVALARSLDLEVVAEGVETEQQLAVLRRLGCTTAQGYLLSRPLPATALAPTLLAGAVLTPDATRSPPRVATA